MDIVTYLQWKRKPPRPQSQWGLVDKETALGSHTVQYRRRREVLSKLKTIKQTPCEFPLKIYRWPATDNEKCLRDETNTLQKMTHVLDIHKACEQCTEKSSPAPPHDITPCTCVAILSTVLRAVILRVFIVMCDLYFHVVICCNLSRKYVLSLWIRSWQRAKYRWWSVARCSQLIAGRGP